MKKTFLIAAAMMFCMPSFMSAQNDDTDIIVTDEEGNEEEFEVPEAMTYELDSLLNLYNAKTYLKPDNNCNMSDVNPVYDKDTYKQRLNRMPTIIEMPYNEVVQQFIDRYSGRLRRSVSYMLGAQNFYIPIFEQALETYGMPLELKYLPVIESALNPKAVSRVGATGLWQFMVTTGKQYGLEVNSMVDERCDPVKSSYAAANYLSDLYKIFGDWNLVIAAYNCGPDNINKAIHRANGAKDYWEIYPYLPKETRGYVPAFIAANYIMNYYCDHNICPMTTTLPVKTDTVMVDRDVHFEQISKVLNIPLDLIANLNPQYRRNIVNGSNKPSAIRLPESKAIAFIDNQDSIYAYVPENVNTKRAEVSVNTSNLAYKDSRSSRHSSSRKSKSRKSRKRTKSVTIRQGDTLGAIAARNNTTVAKLKRLNRIKGSSIRAGKKLKVK